MKSNLITLNAGGSSKTIYVEGKNIKKPSDVLFFKNNARATGFSVKFFHVSEKHIAGLRPLKPEVNTIGIEIEASNSVRPGVYSARLLLDQRRENIPVQIEVARATSTNIGDIIQPRQTPLVRLASRPDLIVRVNNVRAASSVGMWYWDIIIENTGATAVSFDERRTMVMFGYTPPVETSGGWVILAPNGGLYLPPHGTYSYSTNHSNHESSPKRILFYADPYKQVLERNEINNTYELSLPAIQSHPSYTAPTTPPLPDLIVSSVAVTPSTGTPTTEFVVNATIANIGDIDLAAYSSTRVVSSLDGSEYFITALAQGASISFSFPVDHALPPGTKTVIVEVDALDAVEEKNEDNNENSATFVVQ